MSMYVVEKDKNLQKKGIGAMACAMSSSTAFLVARYTSGREHYLLCLEFPGAHGLETIQLCFYTIQYIHEVYRNPNRVDVTEAFDISITKRIHILYS